MLRLQKTIPIAAVITTVLLVICGASSVEATSARLRALGGADYWEDDHNVQRWYGSLADYSNLVVLNSGSFTVGDGWHNAQGRQTSGPSLGAHLKLDQAGRWGTAALFVDSHQNDQHPGSLLRDGLNTSLSGMWSKRYGNLQPALVVRHAEDSDNNWSRSRTDYGFGLRVDVNDGVYFDFATELRSYREDVAGISNTSGDNYGFRTRMFIRLSETVALVPLLDYVQEDRPQPAFQENASGHFNGQVGKVGLGLTWFQDPDHSLLVAIDYTNADENYDAFMTDLGMSPSIAQDWQSMAILLGVETRYAYWFTLRFSAEFRQLQSDSSVSGSKRSDGLNLNLGAAIQLAEYDLDLAISDTPHRSFAQTPEASPSGNDDIWFSLSLRRHW